jgi:hypothetical protein
VKTMNTTRKIVKNQCAMLAWGEYSVTISAPGPLPFSVKNEGSRAAVPT